RADVDALGGESAYRALAAGTDTRDHNAYLLNPHRRGALADELPYFGGGKGRAFFSTAKAKRAGGRPGNDVAGGVAEGDLSVVVGRLHVERALGELALGAHRRSRACGTLTPCFFDYSFLTHRKLSIEITTDFRSFQPCGDPSPWSCARCRAR